MATAKSSVDHWEKKSTDEIVDSLRPGSEEPLTVKDNGTVMQGNTRILTLMKRNYDVNKLPRVKY